MKRLCSKGLKVKIGQREFTKKDIGWYIAIIALVAVSFVAIMLLFTKSNNKAKVAVEEYFKTTVGNLADDYSYQIIKADNIVKSMRLLLEQEPLSEYKTHTRISKSILKTTSAVEVIVVDLNGVGTNSNGEYADVLDADYFNALLVGDGGILFSSNDGITDLDDSIVIARPFNRNEAKAGYIICILDGSSFENCSVDNGFDKSSFCGIVSSEGKCLTYSGSKNPIVLDDNGLWKNLISMSGDEETINNIIEKSAEQTQLLHVSGKTDSKVYVIAPLHIENWRLVISVSRNYFQVLQKREWEQIRLLCLEIMICTAGFLGVFIGFSVFKTKRDREKKEELEFKADTDLLTGLYNKIATEKLIKAYIAQNPDTPCLFMILDLDNFKKINDTMGHTFGDEVLHALGIRLGSQFRVTDIVGRTGGDEFMIFLKNMYKEEDIEAEARKMAFFFNTFQVGEYTKYAATASIGAAVYPRDAKTFEGLYKAADKALYTAKKSGKKQMAFFGKDN